MLEITFVVILIKKYFTQTIFLDTKDTKMPCLIMQLSENYVNSTSIQDYFIFTSNTLTYITQ